MSLRLSVHVASQLHIPTENSLSTKSSGHAARAKPGEKLSRAHADHRFVQDSASTQGMAVDSERVHSSLVEEKGLRNSPGLAWCSLYRGHVVVRVVVLAVVLAVVLLEEQVPE